MKCELYNENFQNYKSYNIPKAQLIIADIPYNIGKNFYGSNPSWYNSRILFSGIKLPFRSPARSRVEIHSESRMSVFLPGTFFIVDFLCKLH